jgi:hypothetical protein
MELLDVHAIGCGEESDHRINLERNPATWNVSNWEQNPATWSVSVLVSNWEQNPATWSVSVFCFTLHDSPSLGTVPPMIRVPLPIKLRDGLDVAGDTVNSTSNGSTKL